MSLSVGIVGLANAGKSTLFNALVARRLAETAPRPFTTIDPHEAVVAVPDANLEKLRRILVSQYPGIEIIPATVTFIDIAGLVKGAHQGEGLGNQFLAKIREVNAIVHVVRAFSNPAVSHPHSTHESGSLDQILEDIEVVNLELELGGVEKKPVIYILNCDEKKISDDTTPLRSGVVDKFGGEVIAICARLEEELIDLASEERREYLRQAGVESSGLEQLIKEAYKILELITFYTIKSGKEVHAWSLKEGSSALDAAAVVHTDFAKNFIKAEVINVDELLKVGGWKEAKERGKIRLEGKDYVVEDCDVIEFKVGV